MAHPENQMAEKKSLGVGATEDGERHRKEAGDEELGGFGIPLLFRIETRTPRAHKPRTCK